MFADRSGALYGATSATAGFRGGAGTIFRITAGDFRIIARFARRGGAYPSAVVEDAAGALYGTTREGGDLHCLPTLGCGAAFKLALADSSYVKTQIHRFKGGSDGIDPGELVIDAKGALYGVTAEGGQSTGCGEFGCGTVFRLARRRSRYRETVLYRFRGGSDGSRPLGGVVVDPLGNVFGVTAQGGGRCGDTVNGCGTVYEIIPTGSKYAERVLYRFGGTVASDGSFPNSLIASADGTLYGTTAAGGNERCAGGCGTVFRLARSGAEYTESVLIRFDPAPKRTPRLPTALLLVADGLYGATAVGGERTTYFFPHGYGTIFTVDLATQNARTIYEFNGPPDGATPAGGLALGAGGLLYGATSSGGTGQCIDFTGCGTIYRLSARPSPPVRAR